MFCQTIGPKNAKILLVGEAPGAEEHATGLPFVGNAGKTLNQLLPAAGLSRAEVLITNVAREQPPGNKIDFFFEDSKCTKPKPILSKWIQLLKEEIQELKPNIVVALGRTACWALTGNGSIKAARGYIWPSTLVPGAKVLPTWHPQACDYQYELRWPAIMDLRKAVRNSETPDFPKDDRILKASPSKREFIDYLKYLYYEHEGPISLDVENTVKAHIDIVGFADSDKHGMSFAFITNKEPRLSCQDELEVWRWIDKVVSTKETILQNGSHDVGSLMHHNGIFTAKLKHDIMIMAHILWPELPRSLGFLASICLNVPAWKHTSSEAPALYNCSDVVNTYGIFNALNPELDRLGMRHTYEFEMRQIFPAVMMQLQGIPISKDKQLELSERTYHRLRELQATLEKDFGKDILIKDLQQFNDCKRDPKKALNLLSPQQLKDTLYIDLGLPVQYKRRKSVNDPKKVTTDKDALSKLARISDNPILGHILEVKKLTKLLNFINIETSPEGRVHTSYNIVGATSIKEEKGSLVDDEDTHRAFGRWSSSKSIILPFGPGNLQNIPKKARKIFSWSSNSSDEIWIVSADYVQAEAVVVAYEIGDQILINLFKKSFGTTKKFRNENHLDVHRLTAATMFQVPIDEVTDDQRTVGKTIRHANNYCVTADTEVLTKAGWLPISQLKNDVQIAQWENKKISFVTPSELLSFDYNEKMFQFKQKSFSQTLSPNHRMPTSLGVKTSDEMFYNRNADLRLPTSGYFFPEEKIDDLDPILFRLICAIQADGSIRERENKREITFTLKKERKILRLKLMLNSLGINASFYATSDSRTGVYINGNEYRWLFDFIKITNKQYGSWLLTLPYDCLDAIVDETKWWDSRRNSSSNTAWTSWQYYSKIKSNCEWIATAAHLTGRRAVLSDSHPSVWTTSIQNRSVVTIDKSERNIVNYCGKIYSVVVPSSFYLIRKDGVISVTGNSAGPGVLSSRLGISMQQAKLLMKIYHSTCPQLHIWHQRIQEELKQTRMLTNLLGRKHKFIGRWDDGLLRSAYSYKPQSTVGDLLNKSLSDIYYKHGDSIHLALQLHDAIYCWTTKDKIAEVMKTLRQEMLFPLTSAFGETYTIDVDFSIGKTWGDMEEVEWQDYFEMEEL